MTQRPTYGQQSRELSTKRMEFGPLFQKIAIEGPIRENACTPNTASRSCRSSCLVGAINNWNPVNVASCIARASDKAFG